MDAVRIVLAQVNVTVGDLPANAARMAEAAHRAAADGAKVVVFPELALSGYPPEDLVLKAHFIEDVAGHAESLANAVPPGLTAIVGAPWNTEGRVSNAALVMRGGRIECIYRKMLLPNYGVFDEQRVFAPGRDPVVIEVEGLRLGLHICEDSWYVEGDPVRAIRASHADAVINLSASPYHRGKLAVRERILGRASAHIGAPLLYCNLVGGQDELVFDGASMAVTPDGVTARARPFAEDLLGVDLPSARGRIETPLADLDEVYAALTRGLRDYVEKNRFGGVIVAISGGIDSALVATLAVDALGADRVAGITLPSRFSSAGTVSDAERLARNLGIRLMNVPIEPMHAVFLESLAPLWPGRAPDATEENVQARIRGTMVMALSNKFGWLVLTTGNKSELATGYCTLYGDMAGGFALIKDVPKTLVFDLARRRNRAPMRPEAPIPESTITRPPSAELRADQKDQDTLPPYDVLDGIIERYVERDTSAESIVADGFDRDTVRRVIRMVDLNEYKRRQGAPGVKITPKAFGRDRRLPITNRYGERL